MRNLLASASLTLLVPLAAGCGPSGQGGASVPIVGPPVETEPAHGAAYGQKPAFPGQTRAPMITLNVAFEARTITKKLEHPWAVEVLEDGRMLVTERPGRLRIVSPDGTLSKPVAGLPAVDAREQGGLLEVALDPEFRSSSMIYWTYAEPREGGNGTALARGRLVASGPDPSVEDVQVLFRQIPTLESTKHFGSRIAFAPDGTLFLTLGERSILEGRVQAQDLGSHFGKIARLRKDGSVPEDNPFFGQAGVLPEIWSYGHRNIQSAAIHPVTSDLWVVDHGPKGGDEINVAEMGKNYGWPVITYGIEYTGEPVGEGHTARQGMEQPLYYWDPVIAPSGMLFYTGDLFPAWRGSLFVGSLVGKHLARLTLDGRRIVGEERLLTDLDERIRDVVQGPDGAIYLVTDEDAGRLVKLVRRPSTAPSGQP